MRSERTRTPIRDMKREHASDGSGPVNSYKMSPEELEDYLARNAYTAPTNSNGIAEKRGMDLRTKPKQTTKQKIVALPEKKESADVAHKVKEGPDKDFVLTRIAAGKSIASVERELSMKVNELHYWIRKWGWVGITPAKAKEILSGQPLEEVIGMDDRLAGAAKKIEELEDQVLKLDSQNAEVVAASGKAIEKLKLEIECLVKLDVENKQRIEQLTEDRDLIAQERDQAIQAFNELNEEHLRALDTIESLDAEKLVLLQTIEATFENAVESATVETVNHPAHYTAGGIEVIDFIIAKLTDEEFAGFCKGNILKYASRANHKGGFEDIRKVKWYVDRLITEVDSV